MQNENYGEIWGDTVDLRHLLMAMLIGIVVSLTCYFIGLKYIVANYSHLAKNLSDAYALLIGIVGCLLSAVISAKLFKPKRILNEEKFSTEQLYKVLEELNIDQNQEAEELKTVSPQVVAEMKSLQLYDLFAGKTDKTKAGV